MPAASTIARPLKEWSIFSPLRPARDGERNDAPIQPRRKTCGRKRHWVLGDLLICLREMREGRRRDSLQVSCGSGGPSNHSVKVSGGEGGIRTHGTREGSTVFETAPFDHSGTSPRSVGGERGGYTAAGRSARGTCEDFRSCSGDDGFRQGQPAVPLSKAAPMAFSRLLKNSALDAVFGT